MACLSGQYSQLQEEAEWNSSSHLEEEESKWNTPCRIKCLPQAQAQAKYSHLAEEPDEWNTPPGNECLPPCCWIESLPLELLRKVFLHLTKDDLKVIHSTT